MTPDSPKSPREELEARLTTLLLGELSAEEAAALRQAIAQDAELARLESQLKETIGLVREATASQEEKTVEPATPLQLSAERREKLLASFKTTRLEIPTKPRRKFRLNREMLKLAAMVVALLLAGGVVISYFTSRSMREMASVSGELDEGSYFAGVPARESSQARVTTINGMGPTVLSFEPSDSRALAGNKPAESTTPRGGRNLGTTLSAELTTDAALERSKAQILGQIAARSGRTAPAPASGPAPTNKQLAQNAERFRSTIALPESIATPVPGGTPGDVVEGARVNGSYFAGVPDQLGEESNVRGRVELAGEPGGNRGSSWFGGFGAGGGGLGGGAGGPVAPSEGKAAGRLPDAGLPTADSMAFVNQEPGKPQQVDGFGVANTRTPRTSFVYTKPRMQDWDWGTSPSETKDVNGAAPATTANPVPAIEPATGLPVASTAGGKDASGMGLWDTTMDAGPPLPAVPLPAVVAAQPVPSPGNQSPPPASYGIPLTTPDVGGVMPFYKRGQEAAAVVDPATGLPVAGGGASAVTSQSGTAGVPHIDAGFGGTDGGVPTTVVLKGGELPRSTPTRPIRPMPPVATPAPAQKPDAAKTESLPDDLEVLVAQVPNTTAAPFTAPPMPPAKAAPAPTVLEKNAAGQTLSDGFASDRTIELYNVTITNRLFAFDDDSPAGGGLANRTGQRRSGGVVADPTQSTAEGLDWRLQQKVDADGDSVSRLDRLKDLTQLDSKSRSSRESDRANLNPRNPHFGNPSPDDSKLLYGGIDPGRLPQTAEAKPDRLEDLTQRDSKEKALASVQDKLAKVERADDGGVHSVNAVGYVNQNVAVATNAYIAPPVADGERKKESEALISQTFTLERTNGSAGAVTVHYETNAVIVGDDKENKKAGATDAFGVTVARRRIDGMPAGTTPGNKVSSESAGQVITAGEFAGVNASPQVSEASLSLRRRVEIALPPGGENAQGVERETRMQVGPVAINEIQFNPPAQKSGSFAQRLNQTVNRAAGGGAEAGRSSEQEQLLAWQEKVDQATPRSPVVPLGEKQAELERLSKLNQSLQSASREDLRKMATTASPGPELASVLKGLSAEANRRGLLQGERADLNERNRYKPHRELDELNGELDKRLEELRSGVKARLEQLQTEVAKEEPRGLAKLKDADLSQVLRLYQDLSGRQVVGAGTLPPAKITLDIPTSLSREEKIQALDTVLAMNQVATTLQGTNYVKIVPAPQAAQEGERFNDRPWDQLPEGGNVVTHVVQLKNALPNDVQQVIQPFAKLPQSIITIPSSGMIVMRDKPENVARMLEMVKKIDVVPVQEFVDVTIPLKTAPAADIARMLQNSAATGELAAAGRAKIIADEHSNSLLIFAGRQDLGSISNAIRRLDAPIPQGEVETAENNFSTFSLNVSDVSFKLAAASLEKGQMPDPASVRSEEFINAFDYRDPEPKGSAPIAFAWERTRYPFAHNRDLLRFSVKTAASGRQPGRPLNLVLLLDNSGSMERADRVRVLHECVRVLARQLRPEDRVSVVAFARTARLVVDGFSGSNAGNLPEVIGQLAPDGGTNLEDAMNVAYQAALKHFLPNGVNRVVLLTDGAANLGDVEPESLKKKVEAHRKQGVALDCFGIGWDGYNDDLLEVLSRNGDGRYGFVNTPEAAASEFAGQLAGALRVAASDVKVQVEFNPRRVTTYRQIGYAKHQLKKEQFRDNTVDAAEIGAAEQGNALYTVQVNPNGEGPIGVVRVRFKVPGTSDYREHEWALPYSGAATPLEQSSPALRLAATASAFSEWLVSSQFASEVTPDRLLGYLSGVPETCAADPRPKKLEWMIRQARSLAGK